METRELIARIYDHVEADETDKAAMACLRLARKVRDAFNVILFLRELYPDIYQLRSAFSEETRHLNKEASEHLWKATQDRWLAEHTIDYSLDPDDKDRNILAMGVGELRREAEQMERSCADLRLPEGMDAFDVAAFTDRNNTLRAEMRLKIRACNTVLERIRTRCLYYASRIEGQLEAESDASNFVGSLQNQIHNYYAERCEAAYQSLRKAASLIASTDPEDHALLLTSIRRAVKAVADFHYPPAAGPVLCQDGQTRALGEEQYLNRLQEFCAQRFHGDASGRLLGAELDYLSVFVRRLHDVASKGVHADVTRVEARQGLLGTYIFLSNLISKLNEVGG